MSERRKPDFGNVRAGVATTPRTRTRPSVKPRADFSNVTSGSRSTAPAATPRTYTVRKGDSLSKIAKAVYGDARKWKRIHEANEAQIADADLIHPGQVLTIPALNR